MSDAHFEMFTSTGAIRTDFTDKELKSLSEDRLRKWATLAAANEAMIEAERKHADTQAGVVAAVKASQEADDALTNARPVVTHLDLVRAASEAQRTGVGAKPDPEVEQRVLAAAAAADVASLAVATAHRARAAADIEVKQARVIFARALQDWSADAPVPTQHELIAHVATTQAERAAAEKALTETKPATHLDAFLKGSQGKRGRAREFPNGRTLAAR